MTPSLPLRPVTVLLLLSMTLVTACGWFGGGGTRSEPAPAEAGTNPLIPTQNNRLSFKRPPPPDPSVRITTIDALTVERTPTGAIVLATGSANRTGAFDAVLRNPEGQPQIENGALLLEFVVTYPKIPTATGTAKTRQVQAAATLTTQTLRQINAIRVIGLENSRETRRR